MNNHKYRFLLVLVASLVIALSNAYINIEQYCKAFDESFRPVICIIKENNNESSHVIVESPKPFPVKSISSEIAVLLPNKLKLKPKPPPPRRPKPRPIFHNPRPRPRPPPPLRPRPIFNHPEPNNNWEEEEEEDDCTCDLNCYPVIPNQNTNSTSVSFRCRSCGSRCWIKSSVNPNCSCAIPSELANCSCSATCASFRSESIISPNRDKAMRMSWGWSSNDYEEESDEATSAEDFNCIFNISNLTDTSSIGEEVRPYNCACCKSTEAQRTSDPDFVCICQRVSITERLEPFSLPGDDND